MSSENSQSMDGPLKSGNSLPAQSMNMETDWLESHVNHNPVSRIAGIINA